MAVSLASFDSALKQYYTPDKIENLVYKNNPFFALVPKDEGFVGRNMPINIIYANPQGRSKTFTKAQARGAVTNSKVDAFLLTRIKDYSLVTIENEVMEASKTDRGAFMSARTMEIDGGLQNLSNSIASGLFRASSGTIGRVVAEPTVAGTTVFTLQLTGDVTDYEVDKALEIWSGESTGTQRVANGTDTTLIIKAVDRTTGVITLVEPYTAAGTIAAGDFIFNDGDRGIGISGLKDWIPSVAPTSSLFFGVDRTVDPTRLGGIRAVGGASKPIEEALIDLSQVISREGGDQGIPDYAFVSHTQFGNLQKSLSSQIQRVNLKLDNDIGFTGIMINGNKGPVTVLADRSCPDNLGYMLTMSSWKLCSLNKAVRILQPDGMTALRLANADGIEVRAGCYLNLGCSAPGFNGVTELAV
jgi:hypothetical protein